MQTHKNTNIDRIIAKLDNDFNIDNTDYVPRVAAWVIEALGILKCTPTERVKKQLPVVNRIAYSDCNFDAANLKVYDENGCPVADMSKGGRACCNPSTGTQQRATSSYLMYKIDHESNPNPTDGESIAFPDGIDLDTKAIKHKVVNTKTGGCNNRGYYVIDDSKLELNYDADYVTIEYDGIKTSMSCNYGCQLPVVPNNALLIEAVTYYCMYKILCRGQKHPVFNLSASQYGTNPYYMWITLQEKVKRSVMFDAQGNILEDDGDLWDAAAILFALD